MTAKKNQIEVSDKERSEIQKLHLEVDKNMRNIQTIVAGKLGSKPSAAQPLESFSVKMTGGNAFAIRVSGPVSCVEYIDPPGICRPCCW
jgi:hypothetical protein